MRSGSVFSYHSFVDFGRFGGVHLHLKESISNGETLVREDVVEERVDHPLPVARLSPPPPLPKALKVLVSALEH